MLKFLICSLLTFLFLLSCESQNPHWSPIISDAIHQAFALEKLPDVNSVLASSDTVFMFPVKFKNDSTLFNESLADDLPNHIDKWQIKPITQNDISTNSKNDRFDYVVIYKEFTNDACIVNMIKETTFPPNSNLIQIDRGRLTIRFIHKNDFWVIDNIIIWYG